jgi:hypothetical protein
MNVRWTLNRLRTAGVRELGFRGVRYLRLQLQRHGFDALATATVGPERGRPWVDPFPEQVAKAGYVATAEQILRGEFRLFGEVHSLGFPPRWNRDAKSGREGPLVFGKTLDYRDEELIGDIKYLWEPNRHLEVVTLAQAWRLTGEARFAEGVRTLVASWLTQCPYLLGPNWTSSLEVGLRLANWACAWHLLGGEDAALFASEGGQGFKMRWLNAARQHCHFVFGYLSEYSSANNHLLGELFGLLLGATTWPCWRESQRWRAYACARFEEQALLQNWADGVNKEQAIWYQHEVADMMLLAGLVMRANAADFSPTFWERLEAMLEFIAGCMDSSGNVPLFGDSDEAVMVRLCPAGDFSVFRSLLASGSVLFNRGDFKRKARIFDDKSRWLLGDAAAAQFAAIPADSLGQHTSHSFPDGGWYILGSDFETEHEVRVLADAAPLGYLAIAAHGHADALSITLSAAGQPVLVDPGTYCYHTQKQWRDYFRGTSAHNTVRIDGLDQSVSGGNFMWLRHARTHCSKCEPDGALQRVVAEHDGYQRLRDPVIHRRELLYDTRSRVLTVTDELECNGQHVAEIFWHFAPHCTLVVNPEGATARCAGVQLQLRWPRQLSAELVRGQIQPCLGWFSPHFDEKVPSPTLVLRGDVTGRWQATTEIRIAFAS